MVRKVYAVVYEPDARIEAVYYTKAEAESHHDAGRPCGCFYIEETQLLKVHDETTPEMRQIRDKR